MIRKGKAEGKKNKGINADNRNIIEEDASKLPPELECEVDEFPIPPLLKEQQITQRLKLRKRETGLPIRNPWTQRTKGQIWIRQKHFRVMDASIGVNLRVTAHSNQGGRKYMEDMFCVAYQPTSDEKDLLYAYFGIFDGHGGREAALYAKTHLMDHIVSQKNFWSDEDEHVLRSIRDGFISVHQAMFRELDKWPKTQSGLPSTSGTTASVAFVRRGKLYIGHVGDSGIVLGYQDPNSNYWKAKQLTNDHKPESPMEHARIVECGGKVIAKSGVPRVVWNRPRIGHKGPVRRSTLIDEIPFLAVARSLGDLWSYNAEQDEYVVSPVPDVAVIEIDVNSHRCLILGSDGLWNMLTPQDAVNSVFFAEKNNEKQHQLAAAEGNGSGPKNWINPSKRLVDRALDRWYANNLRADNTSVVTVVIDPPGPPKKQPSPRNANATSTTHDRSSSSRSPCAHSSVHPNTPNSRFQRSVASTRHSADKPSPRPPPLPQVVPEERAASGKQKSAGRVSVGSQSRPISASALNESTQRRPDRPNRRRRAQKPLNSSKTSRVLAKAIKEEPIENQETDSDSMLESSASDNQDDLNDPLFGDVQIHEISSSCETVKAEGAEPKEAATPVPPAATKSTKKKIIGKVNKRMPKSSASTTSASAHSSSRKRVARASENTPDEAATQRKIMKVSNETVSLRRPSVAKKRVTSGLGKDGVGKPRSRPKVTKPVLSTSERLMALTGCIITETKENGRKLSRRVPPPTVNTRTTRGTKEPANSEQPPLETAVVSTGTPKKTGKSVDASMSPSSNHQEGNKVTTMKKNLRGNDQQSLETIESQEAPATTKRLTRGVGLSNIEKPPLKQKNVLSSATKKEGTAGPRVISPRTSRGSISDSPRRTQKKVSKVGLKRLKGKKSASGDKESSPGRRAAKKGNSATDDEEAGTERSLRSNSASGIRVTRSMKK